MTEPDPLEALRRLRDEVAADPTRQSNYVPDLDAAIAAWEKERENGGQSLRNYVDRYAALRAEVLKVAEEMEGLPKAVEYVRGMGTAIITGPYIEWAARLRKAAQ